MGFYQKSTLFANGLEFIAMAKVGRLQMKGDSYTLKIFCNHVLMSLVLKSECSV